MGSDPRSQENRGAPEVTEVSPHSTLAALVQLFSLQKMLLSVDESSSAGPGVFILVVASPSHHRGPGACACAPEVPSHE